jgi:hypothetical protein
MLIAAAAAPPARIAGHDTADAPASSTVAVSTMDGATMSSPSLKILGEDSGRAAIALNSGAWK